MATAQDKDEQKEIEHLHKDLLDHLKNIPKVENFADCLHSIYYIKLGSSVEEKYVDEFEKIKKQVRNDAFLFLNVLLPLTEEMLTYIQNFFEEYDDSYEEWEKGIEGILEDVKEKAENARVVRELAENLATDAKNNKMQTETLLEKLKLEDDYKKNTEKCRKKAESCKDKSTGNINACVKFLKGLKKKKFYNEAGSLKDERKEWLQKHFPEINNMLEALENFIASINGIAAFSFLVHKDIENCSKVSKKSKVSEESKENVPDPENTNERKKKTHFEATKKKRQDIKYQIQVCFTSIPNIRSSLDAIPKTDIVRNCVQDWVKKNLKEIGYTNFFSRFLYNAIPSIEWTQAS